MIEMILMLVHGALLLVFGVCLSASFVQLQATRKNLLYHLFFCLFCGAVQVLSFILFGEVPVWNVYPVITHIPLILFLCIGYRKRPVTALAAVSTAYLCCQPAKWFGLLVFSLTQNTVAEYAAQMIALVAVGFLVLRYFAPGLGMLFSKDTASVCIFGIIPVVYYLFDYATVIYTDLWLRNNRTVAEFLPFLLCMVFLFFCTIYYKGYEEKADLERREQIIHITIEQQARELETARRNEQEVRILRHDMRLFLDSLAVSIQSGEHEKALDLIQAYASRTNVAPLQRFCSDSTINYILSDFSEKCQAKQIAFTRVIQVDELDVDATLFASILSNALDNALNAQAAFEPQQRSIRLMLKTVEGKLLLSVKNPVKDPPVFADGLPVSKRKGHGYGAQSIRYMTQRLGGNCQFSVQDGMFILRVVI